MSTQPRVSSAIAGEPPHFASVLAHQPALAASFYALYGAFWASDTLSARVKEICRMRNARITACGFCRQVRFAKPLEAGLDEAVIDEVTDDYAASAKLSDAEKAALRFTDALIHDPELFDDAARTALERHYTAEQIAELALGVLLFLALAKVLITLGLEPEQLDRTVIATPVAPAAHHASAASSVLLPDDLQRLLGHRPELRASLTRLHGAAWSESGLDPALLTKARERIAQVHDMTAFEASETGEELLLAYAELIPFAHHAITDAQAATVRGVLGNPGYVAFSVAVALFDAFHRARLVLGRRLTTAAQPSLRSGVPPSHPLAASATIA